MITRPLQPVMVERIPSLQDVIGPAEATLSPRGRTEFGRTAHAEALSLLLRSAASPHQAATVALRQVAQMMSNHDDPRQQAEIDHAVAAVLPAADRHLSHLMEDTDGSGAALIAMLYAIADVIQNGDTTNRPPPRHRIQ